MIRKVLKLPRVHNSSRFLHHALSRVHSHYAKKKYLLCAQYLGRGVITLELFRHIFQHEHTPKRHCTVHNMTEEAACKISQHRKVDLLNSHVEINAMEKAIFNEERICKEQTEPMRCCYNTSLLLTRKSEFHNHMVCLQEI